MTQFKEKSAKQREPVSAGLFFYPVGSDVFAYKAQRRWPGDQRQHVELCEIARRFNERFGPIFVEPEHRIPGRRADHGPAGADQQDVVDGRQ
jgi:tryptophanyl-tRNA synthetase